MHTAMSYVGPGDAMPLIANKAALQAISKPLCAEQGLTPVTWLLAVGLCISLSCFLHLLDQRQQQKKKKSLLSKLITQANYGKNGHLGMQSTWPQAVVAASKRCRCYTLYC